MIKVNFLLTATLLIVVLVNPQTTIAQDSTDTNPPEINVTMKQVPEGLTAKDVIDNYLEAIGGKEKFSNVEDRTTIMRGEIMGQNLSIVIKQKVPNKLKQNIRSGEMKQTILYDGTKGVIIIGDEKTEFDNKKLEKLPEIMPVAAISVGIIENNACLDLDYAEDSNAETDMNVVMDETGEFIEIQGTAEGKTFSMDEMMAMTEFAKNGIAEIISHQKQALEADI